MVYSVTRGLCKSVVVHDLASILALESLFFQLVAVEGDYSLEKAKPAASSPECNTEMKGSPPVTVLVEFSLNGQQYTPTDQLFTYYDPNYFPAPILGAGAGGNAYCPRKGSFSFHPTTGSTSGGTLVTVYGLAVNNINCGLDIPYSSRNDASMPTEFDVWPRSAEQANTEHGSETEKTTVSVRGVPMKVGLSYNCRFGAILVRFRDSPCGRGHSEGLGPAFRSTRVDHECTAGFSVSRGGRGACGGAQYSNFFSATRTARHGPRHSGSWRAMGGARWSCRHDRVTA